MSPRISIIFKTIKYLAIGLAALTVALLCSWFFRADEPLKAEVAAVLARKTEVPISENLYPALWGFASDLTYEPHKVGQEILAAIQIASANDLEPTPKHEQYAKIVEKYQSAEDFKLADRSIQCGAKTPNCALHYRELAAKVAAETAVVAPYFSRYRALRDYPKFAETMPLTALSPNIKWYQLTWMSTLVDAQIAQDMIEPVKRANALRDLAGEMALWRRIAHDTDTLLAKLVALSVFGSKVRLASELLTLHPEIVSQHAQIMAEITKPLPPETASMTRALEGETRLFATVTRDIELGGPNAFNGAQTNVFERAFMRAGAYKPNATLNAHFNHTRAATDGTKQCGAKKLDAPTIKQLADFLYNPIGTIMSGISAPLYSTYTERSSDLLGYSRLVELQRQILVNKTPRQDVAQLLADSSVALFDSHTNQPMSWNAKTGEIFFAARSQDFRDQFGERVRVAVARD